MRILAVVMLSVVSATAMSASVKLLSKYTSGTTDDGKAYDVYSVTCSDKTEVPITRWLDDKSWCLGELGTEQCAKNKMKIAMMACEIR